MVETTYIPSAVRHKKYRYSESFKAKLIIKDKAGLHSVIIDDGVYPTREEAVEAAKKEIKEWQKK